MRSIVVGTDGSDTAAQALREACELAKTTGAKLHIVSAYVSLGGVRVVDGRFLIVTGAAPSNLPGMMTTLSTSFITGSLVK